MVDYLGEQAAVELLLLVEKEYSLACPPSLHHLPDLALKSRRGCLDQVNLEEVNNLF